MSTERLDQEIGIAAERQNRFDRASMAILLAGSLLVAGSTKAEDESFTPSSPLSYTEEFIEHPLPGPDMSFTAPVPSKYIEEVERSLEEPGQNFSDNYDEMYRSASGEVFWDRFQRTGMISITDEEHRVDYMRVAARAKYAVHAEVAERHEQTVYDASSTLDELYALADDPLSSFDAFLAAGQEYTAKFGIAIRFANEQDLKTNSNVRRPTTHELTWPAYKNVITELVKGLSVMSQEEIELSGMRNLILLTNEDQKDAKFSAYVGGKLAQGDVAINMSTDAHFNAEVLWHEQSHLVDRRITGGREASLYDKQYVRLNGLRTYGADDDAITTAQEMDAKTQALKSDMYNAYDSDPKKSCDIQTLLRKKYTDIVFVSNYAGSENVLEDKAEIGAHLYDPLNAHAVLRKDTPKVRAKYVREIARILYFEPNIARYILDLPRATGSSDMCTPHSVTVTSPLLQAFEPTSMK